jgi:predicted nucleotidyltransferase
MATYHPIAEQDIIIKLLNVLFPQITIYLFGSRARGTHTEQSDIDLALDIGRKMTLQELSRAKNVLDGLNLAQTIDIVDLHRISSDMKKIILAQGILWKQSN